MAARYAHAELCEKTLLLIFSADSATVLPHIEQSMTLSPAITCSNMTKATLYYDIVSPWSFMAYSGPSRLSPGLNPVKDRPDNSADFERCAAYSAEAIPTAVGHAARAEAHVPWRGHAGERKQAVRNALDRRSSDSNDVHLSDDVSLRS